MTDHSLWLDALNYHQQQGKTLAESVSMADQWPFKTVNGVQTPQSLALQSDKSLHRSTPCNLEQYEDAPL